MHRGCKTSNYLQRQPNAVCQYNYKSQDIEVHYIVKTCTVEIKMATYQPLGVSQLSVTTYTGQTFIFKEENIRAEEICCRIAQELNIDEDQKISNRDFNLFRLATKDLKTWLSPNKIIKRPMELVFRLRFQLQRDSENIPMGKVAHEYYFLQCKNDFLNSSSIWETFKDEEILGMAVMDMARICKEEGIDAKQLLKKYDYKLFLPKVIPPRLSWPHKTKVMKKRLKEGLKACAEQQWQVVELKMKYIQQFECKNASLYNEVFISEGPGREEINVSGDNGITVIYGQQAGTEDIILRFDFCDITDIVITCNDNDYNQRPTVVQINRRKGEPVKFETANWDEAESLVSLLDGYYQLLVDYYYCLCEDTASPMQIRLAEAKCHGPLTRAHASERMQQAEMTDGTYLIRQNPDPTKPGGFCLMLAYDDTIKNYPVDVNRDGEVSLPDQPKHKTLKHFIDEYKVSNRCLPVELKKCVPPVPKDKSLLLRRSGEIPDIQRSPKPGYRRENTDSGVWIQEKDLLKERHPMEGEGVFTKVYKGTYSENNIKSVAVKCLTTNKQYEKKLEEVFFRTADKIMFLENPHIVGIVGVRQNTLVMEYVKFGSLGQYLRNNNRIQTPDLFKAVIQIAQACEYLEEKSFVHGSICARNVLVASDPDTGFIVKLGDPMFGSIYYALPFAHEARLKRVPWTPPEHLVQTCRANSELDRFAYGVFCWEVFHKGREPTVCRDEEIRHRYLREMRPPLNGLPTPVAKIISSCWHQDPTERPTFKCVLRDFRKIITAGTVDINQDSNTWERSVSEFFENGITSTGNGDSGVAEPPNNALTDSRHGLNNEFDLGPAVQSQAQPNQPRDIVVDDSSEDIFDTVHIEPKSLELEVIIGSGHYGEVYKGTWKKYPNIPEKDEIVAVKKLPISLSKSAAHVEDFRKEIQRTSKLDCDWVVKVKGICQEEVLGLMMIMEFLPKGSLNSYLKKNVHLSMKILCLYAQQIAKGMEYLEKEHVVHRDLAARNILVASSERVKISDFGLARVMNVGSQNQQYYRQRSNQHNPILWHSPESMAHSKFTSKGDVWGYAVLLWEIFTFGDRPKYYYHDGAEIKLENLYYHLKKGGRLSKPLKCPQNVYDIMRQCWEWEDTNRPTFTELVALMTNIISQY
ncbi:tyrosine-protein kinase JAK2-like [Glandiceps talaboti]